MAALEEQYGVELSMLSSGVTILYSDFMDKKKREVRCYSVLLRWLCTVASPKQLYRSLCVAYVLQHVVTCCFNGAVAGFALRSAFLEQRCLVSAPLVASPTLLYQRYSTGCSG
jgi:hypothetical protein